MLEITTSSSIKKLGAMAEIDPQIDKMVSMEDITRETPASSSIEMIVEIGTTAVTMITMLAETAKFKAAVVAEIAAESHALDMAAKGVHRTIAMDAMSVAAVMKVTSGKDMEEDVGNNATAETATDQSARRLAAVAC